MALIAVEGCEVKIDDPTDMKSAAEITLVQPTAPTVKIEGKGAYSQLITATILGYSDKAAEAPYSSVAWVPAVVIINATATKAKTKEMAFVLEGDTGTGVVNGVGTLPNGDPEDVTSQVTIKVTDAGQSSVECL